MKNLAPTLTTNNRNTNKPGLEQRALLLRELWPALLLLFAERSVFFYFFFSESKA